MTVSTNSINNKVFDNDFTINRISSVNHALLTVENTQDAATQVAMERITVAGEASSDCWTNWTVKAIDGFSIGIDNSDANKLKLCYAAGYSTPSDPSQYMTVTIDGEINYPATPSFQARLTADVLNATGNSTLYDIIPDTVTFDQSGDYNNITGLFVAPVTGRYLFTGMIWYTNTVADTDSAAYLRTSNREYRSIYKFVVGSTARLNFSHIVDMDAADIANMAIVVNGEAGNTVTISSAAVNAATYFAGHLLA